MHHYCLLLSYAAIAETDTQLQFCEVEKKNHSNPVVNIGRAAGDFGRNWTGKTVRDKNEKLKR